MCKDKKDDDKIPNFEDNCQSFFVCKQGIPDESSCATGLLYNPLKGHCDWPKNVDCVCDGNGCPSNSQGDTAPLPHPPSPAPTVESEEMPTSQSSEEAENSDDANLPSPPMTPGRPLPQRPTITATTHAPWFESESDKFCVEGTPEHGSADPPIPPPTIPPTIPPTVTPTVHPTPPTVPPTWSPTWPPTWPPTGTPSTCPTPPVPTCPPCTCPPSTWPTPPITPTTTR